jgi:hypothetical protein
LRPSTPIFENLFLGRVHLGDPGHRKDNGGLVAHDKKVEAEKNGLGGQKAGRPALSAYQR